MVDTQGTELRVVWGITGSGDLLAESIAAMEAVTAEGGLRITAVLSKAAVNVLRWYEVWDRVAGVCKAVLVEQDANTPFIAGKLQTGRYDCLLVAPATANSVAKIAHGIADTIITDAVAQAAKARLPVYVLPVDQREGTTVTRGPRGERVELTIRAVDVRNAELMAAMDGICSLAGPSEIGPVLREHLRSKAERS